MHLPRTPDTENLVNEPLLASMKSTARIVNCARGGIINENALAQAIQSGASKIVIGRPITKAKNIPQLTWLIQILVAEKCR